MPASLSPGAHLGPYEIVALIGAGGMGEVYRARDPRLGREVAVKVLRAEGLQVEDRRRRFELEARAASSLNHPNILTIFDIGEEGVPYIVCELLEGRSLREALAKGALPIRQAVEISVEISAGLAAAHTAGITHRDLKPENLFLGRDGRIKILDFGLAKAVETTLPEDATRTLMDHITAPGMIVGTLAYMSPEQARGETVDYRSDQFSLGAIVYEMATGKRPFQREDRVATLSAIVGQEPPPLPATDVPPPMRWIVDRCLAKDPARRYSSTADLHRQFRDVLDHWSEMSSVSPAPAATEHPRLRMAPMLAAAGACAAGFLLALLVGPRGQPQENLKYTPLATEAVNETQPAWSPDGQSLAYVADVGGVSQVLTRALSASAPAQITKSARNCVSPFWSADGTRIYYWSASALWAIGAAGGEPQLVMPDVITRNYGRAAALSPDGKTLAFLRANGPMTELFLQRDGGSPAGYRKPPFPASFRFADGLSMSPDGTKLAVNLLEKIDVKEGAQLWIVPLPEGTPRRVPLKLSPRARPRPFSWTSDNRHMVFAVEGTPGEGTHLYVLDTESGDFRAITRGAGEERDPAVSPDNRRIAFTNAIDDSDLIEFSIDGAKAMPLLATSRHEYGAEWAPSGQQYVYGSDASGEPGIWIRSVAEGWVRLVASGPSLLYLEISPPRFSPDGQRLAYLRAGGEHAIYISNLSGGPAVPLEQESTDQHSPAWSPDGSWIAYARFVGQNWEIVKAPAGGGGKPTRLCERGDSTAWLQWSRDGRSICFSDPAGIHLVSSSGGQPQQIHGPCGGFSYTKDGGAIYAVRRAKDRHWELATLRLPDGAVLSAVPLNLAADKDIRNINLHPDGTRFVATVYTMQRDIWILDGARLK